MANPTTNFGWQMPQNTDLVKDLPADFEVFGQAVDTDLADLKGGTTGQVLSKTTNTDLDFTWITPTDQTPLTTKGDLFTFTTVDARLGVGANGTVLTADSAEATGLKWATPAGGGKVLQVVHSSYSTELYTTSATYADTGLTATITPTANTSTILIIVMHNGIQNNQSIADKWATFRLMKSTTELTEYEKLAAFSSTTARLSSNTSGLTYLDSPATTSATTYKTQIATNGSGGHVVQYGGSRSTICLMEIGA